MRPPKEQRSPHDIKTATAPFNAPAPSAAAAPPARQGDRGNGDDAATTAQRLPVFVRFSDLRTAGITDNWTHLMRLISEQDFPTGILLSPNIRAWNIDEVQQWLSTRPTARKTVPSRKQKEHEAA